MEEDLFGMGNIRLVLFISKTIIDKIMTPETNHIAMKHQLQNEILNGEINVK